MSWSHEPTPWLRVDAHRVGHVADRARRRGRTGGAGLRPRRHGARGVRRAASRRRCPRAGPARRDRRGGRRRRYASRPSRADTPATAVVVASVLTTPYETFGARLVGHRCPRPDRGGHGRAPRPPGHRPGARADVADGHPGGGLERARPRPAFRPRSSCRKLAVLGRLSTTCSSESPERSIRRLASELAHELRTPLTLSGVRPTSR